MFVLKNMFNRLLENKMAVVADYYEVKLMEDKKRRKEDDHSCQRNDPSAPSFVYNNDESASLPNTSKEIQKTSMEISESTQGFRCPTCLVSYRGYLVFKCEKCEQPFCEQCKWIVYTCGKCGYDLTNSACRDYHREKVVRSASRIYVERYYETFVNPSIHSF